MRKIQLKKQHSKYVLWYTRYHQPILTHQELLPIMENLGFVTAVGKNIIKAFEGVEVPWIEYKYCAKSGRRVEPFRPSEPRLTSKTPPTPQLPFNNIDGLHLYTYIAFLEAVYFYLGHASYGVFHVGGIPVNLDDPDLPHWTYAEQCRALVRRCGTLDPNLLQIYTIENAVHYRSEPVFLQKLIHNYPDPKITMVAIDDIIANTVTDHKDNNSNSSVIDDESQ